jgi:ribonucleoside-diphosphate reductase alpha chain
MTDKVQDKIHCEECEGMECSITQSPTLAGLQSKVHSLRYAASDQETWDQTVSRTANAISLAEQTPELRNKYASLYHQIMIGFDFVPGGRVLRNASKVKGNLLNCFVLEVEDTIESIANDLYAKALIVSKYGGGVGFNVSALRPAGEELKSQGANSLSSGAISFVEGLNHILKLIKGGGDRRAAGKGDMLVWHPEIYDFIKSKNEDGRLENFNLSVGVTGAFIKAVKGDKDWELIFGNKVYKTVRAKELWDYIISHTWEFSEPGIMNYDKMQNENNLWYCDTIAATNPCVDGNSLISTTMGDMSVKSLTKYKSVEVYSVDAGNNMVIKRARFFRTKTKARMITVKTTRGDLKCTPNHKFITPGGTVEADQLVPGMKLFGLLRRKRNETHVLVGVDSHFYTQEEKLVMLHYCCPLTPEYVIHHIDGNPYNNAITNLQMLPHYIHSIISNNGHEQWNETNHLGQFVAKDKLKKKKSKEPITGKGIEWKVLEIDETPIYGPVFDGQVEDTHCYFANGILVHNCGELPLPANSACCLGSINLSNMYDAKKNEVNWKKLKETIQLAIRFLDSVLDVTYYPITEIGLNVQAARRIGLGTMGLHHLMLKLGIKEYGSDEALEFIDDFYRRFRDVSYLSSTSLAQEKGPFDKFIADKFLQGSFVSSLPRRIRKNIKTMGIRNGTILSIAPTGTIGLLAGTSQGLEPIFSPIYKRKYYEGGDIKEVTEWDTLFKDFVEQGKDVSHFIGAYEVSPSQHLEVQNTVQQYIDNSISKTINIANDYPKGKLSSLLLDHIEEIKGTTVYRAGSKGKEILTPCEYKMSQDKLLKLLDVK